VSALAVLPGGRRALSASEDTTLRLWDLDTGGCLALFPCDAPLTALDVSRSDEAVVAVGDSRGEVSFFRIEGLDC
jgi:WD40 repeat protein